MTAYKSLLYLIFEAGLFALYIPLVFLRSGTRIETGIVSFLAIPLWLIGSLIVLWCFWDFTFKGRGTPVPMDPPKELVVTGFYRYVRNPIYLGVLSIFGTFLMVWILGITDLHGIRVYRSSLFRCLIRRANFEKKIRPGV
jgi:protein-S-isoprenylcysteine O-methyltransferase Ste14